MILAGNFGELRPNHFHMGIDIKTQGKEGFEIHAIEDGYVSRVKIATHGYGKLVCITHPNGYTSAYAHCSKIVGKLDSLLKVEQYKQQRFEVDLRLEPTDFPIKKGDVFALTGNTGGSMAPHLHFEIRDAQSNTALNPLIYAYDIADSRKPIVNKLRVYSLNEQGYMVPNKTMDKSLVKKADRLGVYLDTVKIPASFCSTFGGIGLSFDGFDKLDGAENVCGLYGTYLIVDGDTIFGQRIDRISFENSRYINSHRDLTVAGANYHKSFRNVSNPLEIYISDKLGVISILPGQTKNVRYIAYDAMMNQTVAEFVLEALEGEIAENYNPSIENYWYPDSPLEITKGDWSIKADSFSIYEPYLLSNKNSSHLCDTSVLLQKKVNVRMKLTAPTKPIEKYYLSVGGRSLPTSYNNGWLEAKSNVSGTISIMIDETPPVVKPINASSVVKSSVLKFYISDSQSGLASYDLYIDGRWYLLEYEYKGNLAFFEVPEELKECESLVKLVVRDACNNSTQWERTIRFE